MIVSCDLTSIWCVTFLPKLDPTQLLWRCTCVQKYYCAAFTDGNEVFMSTVTAYWPRDLDLDLELMILIYELDLTILKMHLKNCTGCQSLRGSSTSCTCWFTSRFWDTRPNISQTFWHRLPIFQVDLHGVRHRVATSSWRRHVDELATEPLLLLHCEHGIGCRQSWNCCDRWTCFVVIWKHFCFILSTSTRIPLLCDAPSVF